MAIKVFATILTITFDVTHAFIRPARIKYVINKYNILVEKEDEKNLLGGCSYRGEDIIKIDLTYECLNRVYLPRDRIKC